MRRRIWPVAAAAVIGCIILVALGFWQLHRLQWKEALLAELEQRAAAAPIPLAEALAREPDSLGYLKVTAEGTYAAAPELRVLTAFEGKPGWHLVRPFITADGIAVLVDRGVAPEDMPEAERRAVPSGPTSLRGTIARRAMSPGLFTPANDPAKNIWYGWDVPTMLAAANLAADLRVAPFVVQTEGEGPGYPKPAPLSANLRNNHLGYALTWFGMAIVLAVMASVFIRQQLRRGGA